jgi:hypothetical protein
MARLAKNFPHMKNITPELIEDRARDVQGFTLEVVDKACELLRRSEEFFPSASRLVETCERLRDTQKASSYNAYCGLCKCTGWIDTSWPSSKYPNVTVSGVKRCECRLSAIKTPEIGAVQRGS